MDETQTLLTAILHRLETLDAKVNGLQNGFVNLRKEMADLRTEVADLRTEVADLRKEMNRRFDKVDERFEYMGQKWIEHDEAIYRLKHKEA